MADRGDDLPMNTAVLKRFWEAETDKDAILFANLRNSWRTIAQYAWGINLDILEFLMGRTPPSVTGKHYLRPTVDNLVAAVARALVQSLAT